MFKDIMFDESVNGTNGCVYCTEEKTINTNGSDFKLHINKDKKEYFIYSIGEYKSIDIRYCPFCGRKLYNL